MRKFIFPLLFTLSTAAYSQVQIGPFVGASGYLGDLSYKPLKRLKPAIGISGLYQITNRINLRASVSIANVEGGDEWSGTAYMRQIRNLSFASAITEVNLGGEFTLFNLDKINWSPYLFAGVAAFHFNPYTIYAGNKVYLKPLSTEGEGLSEYPGKKPYSLTQLAVPFGGGIKYLISDNVTVAAEFGLRITSTDYLDDVSNTYIDSATLFSERGPLAVKLAFRGNEVVGGNTYPAKDAVRGNPKYTDWYYLIGFHLFFRINKSYGIKKGYGCPANPL